MFTDKFGRGISCAADNIEIISQVHNEIAECLANVKCATPTILESTFVLPDIKIYSENFQKFLQKDLFDNIVLHSLESSRRLNWWNTFGIFHKLWPLSTLGDGNCLLHAVSLALWGFHDRKLTLRRVLYNELNCGQYRDSLYRRWRFRQTQLNKEANFVYSDEEWKKEWREIVSISSPQPRDMYKKLQHRISITSQPPELIASDSTGLTSTYEGLEEIHILALAHVLRRPIIVISDTIARGLTGEAIAPVFFGGIYLPFEVNYLECNKNPILLAYDSGHFSPLVFMEIQFHSMLLVPLVDYQNKLFPMQFDIDPGPGYNWENSGQANDFFLSNPDYLILLKKYLHTVAVHNSNVEEDVYNDLLEEEVKKEFIESEMLLSSSEEETNSRIKKKNSKQIENFTRLIKRNVESFSKIGLKNPTKKEKLIVDLCENFANTRILCTRLHIKQSPLQELMMHNYLVFAYNKFLQSNLDTNVIKDKECFNLSNEKHVNDLPIRYETGNSKFYTNAEKHGHNVQCQKAVRKFNELDQTLYLSNSTFYNDNLAPTPNESIVYTRNCVGATASDDIQNENV